MIFFTERERGIHFISKIMMVFGLAILIPFIILAFTALPLFGETAFGLKLLVAAMIVGGLSLFLISLRRTLLVLDYIEIDPQTRTITLFEKKQPTRSGQYSESDALIVDREDRSSVDSGDPNTYAYFHIRLSAFDRASIYESRGELNALRKAKELGETMGIKVQVSGEIDKDAVGLVFD